MSLREYYTCNNCGFFYEDINYYFCFRDDTGFLEKYESLFSTMDYADGSILRGAVEQHYCSNCNKIVHVYQTGLGSSLFTKESTIDFMKELLPKKQEKLLKTAVLLKKLVDLVQLDASLMELKEFLEKHDDDFYYKINLDDYLTENSFKNIDLNINDYIKEEHDPDLNEIHSDDLNLTSIYGDLSNHYKKLSTRDLNMDNFYSDISQKFNYLSDDLRDIEKEIPCINYCGDDYNIRLDGEKIDRDVCPECGEKFYVVSPKNPCPKCGKKEIEYSHVFCD